MSDQAAIVAIVATLVPAIAGWLFVLRLRRNLHAGRAARHGAAAE